MKYRPPLDSSPPRSPSSTPPSRCRSPRRRQHRHLQAQLARRCSPCILNRRLGGAAPPSPRSARTAGSRPSRHGHARVAGSRTPSLPTAGTNGEELIETLRTQLPSHSHRRRALHVHRRGLQGLRERVALTMVTASVADTYRLPAQHRHGQTVSHGIIWKRCSEPTFVNTSMRNMSIVALCHSKTRS